MIILGRYKLFKRTIGYRRAHCHFCKRQRTILRVRYFPVIHAMFIPIIPMFRGEQWVCEKCGGLDERLSPWIPFLTGLLLAVFAGTLYWSAKIEPYDGGADPVSNTEMLIFVGIPAALSVVFFWVARFLRRRTRNLEAESNDAFHREFITHGASCWICGGELMFMPNLMCSQCGLRVHIEINSEKLESLLMARKDATHQD